MGGRARRDARGRARSAPGMSRIYALSRSSPTARETPGRLRPARARLLRRATSSPTPRCRRRSPRPSTASCSTPSRATASSTRARWRCCCGWPASPRASSTGFSHRRDRPQDRRVRRARLRRALLGRGLLPGLGLDHVRPDARRLARPQPARRRRQLLERTSAAAAARPTSAATRSPSAAPASPPPPSPRRGGGSRRSSLARSPLVGLGFLGAAPLAPRRPAGAVGARARAQAHAPRAGARARPCTRSSCASPTRPPRPATCARCARAATATSRATRPARSAAACGPSSDAEAAFWAAFAPGGPSRPGRPRGPTIGRMDDVYDLYQRGMALLEDGHFHQATIPLAKARDLEPDKTSIREALGPGVLPLRRLRGGARGVRGGGRTRAHQRLRAVLPRPLADDARPRPRRRASRSRWRRT